MSAQHHHESGGSIDPENQRILNNMIQEMQGKRPRSWSQGRIEAEDDGDTHFAIAADVQNKIVRIQFTKPMTWLGFDSATARALAAKLIEKADQIDVL